MINDTHYPVTTTTKIRIGVKSLQNMDSLDSLKEKREQLKFNLENLNAAYHNAGSGHEKSKLIFKILELSLELNEVQNRMIELLEKWTMKTTLL